MHSAQAHDAAQTGRADGAGVVESQVAPAIDAAVSEVPSASSSRGVKRGREQDAARKEEKAPQPQRQTRWSPAATRQVLVLRLRAMKQQFEDAQCAAQERAAWELMATRLCASGVAVDAQQCEAQFSHLFAQWQTHCASIKAGESRRPDPPLLELLAKHFGQDAELPRAGAVTSTATTSADLPHAPIASRISAKKQKAPVRRRKATPLKAAASMEEVDRADEILCALEKQSALLERQAQAQQQRTDLMQQLLQTLSGSFASRA